MEKLKTLNRHDLKEEYNWTFGQYPDGIPTDKIIAAIYYGKRYQYLTAEEIESIND